MGRLVCPRAAVVRTSMSRIAQSFIHIQAIRYSHNIPNHRVAKQGRVRAGSLPATTGVFGTGLLRYTRTECLSALMQSIHAAQRGCEKTNTWENLTQFRQLVYVELGFERWDKLTKSSFRITSTLLPWNGLLLSRRPSLWLLYGMSFVAAGSAIGQTLLFWCVFLCLLD